MRLRHSRLSSASALLVAALGLYVSQAGPSTTIAIATQDLVRDETDVVLPASGSLDERPFFSSRRHPAIKYADSPSTDVVGQLAQKVADGEVRLRFDEANGYLPAVLSELRVPLDSQSIVFSKTSLQSHYISPSNPRAIYFSDNASVAFIRNAPLLELSAVDPRLGVVFYAMEQRQAERPRIARSDSCLSCHESRNTLDVPGMLIRSMAVGTGGQTMPQFGNYVSDHRSPYDERWGGWFITGNTDSLRHMGNTMLPAEGASGPIYGSSLKNLEGRLEGYGSRYSDVAAVMVLNHQARMTNLLIRVGWETRIALDRREKHPEDRKAADRLVEANARELVDYLLFADEAPLPGALESTSGFQRTFAAVGPQDKQGRSLRLLDLRKRLLRYPCSYMIYSPSFETLPKALKDAAFARMWDVLSGKEKSAQYSKLSSADRAAVIEILLATKSDLPAYFKPLGK